MPAIPAWLATLCSYRAGTQAPPSPLDLRLALARHLEEKGPRTIVMESHDRRPGETHTALFARLADQFQVERFLAIWPPGCTRAGLDFEFGYLLGQLQRGDTLDVRVFVHDKAGGIARGRFSAREPGRRTRYYEDLAKYASRIVIWHDWEELFHFVREHAVP